MVDEDSYQADEAGENTMLQEAREALRQGQRARARDLLTRLLKADQTNTTYWIWLSAAVDTKKERLYCLQTALKLDPENATARRGLVILGGLPPDDSVRPFSLKEPRKWAESLAVPGGEKERPRGWANPLVRILAALGIGLAVVGLFLGGYLVFSGKGNEEALYITATQNPTLTLSQTPSQTPAFRTATPTFLGPTPLSFFLPVPYTATPRYVLTEHAPADQATFESGLRFLDAGQYDLARVQFETVLGNEPDAVDVYYFIGESYRLEGSYDKALDSYQEALNRDASFAPALLGRALANLGWNPTAEVLADLDGAIANDPLYLEAYIQRGAYLILRGNDQAALQGMQTAVELYPYSAPAWMYLSQAQLGMGDAEAALQSALEANALDLTLVPVYLTLAQAFTATGDTEQALAVLKTYVIYEPGDATAILTLAAAYNAGGEWQAALDLMNTFIDENPGEAEAYVQRGLAYLDLGNPGLGEDDFRKALTYNSTDFDAQLGLARAYFLQGKPGDAYVYAETYAHPLARTDVTRAQVYYWEALFLEAIDDELSAEGARNSWNRLLDLPVNSVPATWREAAFEHLGITPTFTPTPRRTQTPTRTP